MPKVNEHVLWNLPPTKFYPKRYIEAWLLDDEETLMVRVFGGWLNIRPLYSNEIKLTLAGKVSRALKWRVVSLKKKETSLWNDLSTER